jgi:hypothetical protein
LKPCDIDQNKRRTVTKPCATLGKVQNPSLSKPEKTRKKIKKNRGQETKFTQWMLYESIKYIAYGNKNIQTKEEEIKKTSSF